MKNNQMSKPVVPVGEYVIGTVNSYGGNIDAGALEEQGWLYCDGRLVSRTTYDKLFAVIGTIHGSGDGTTNFNLPDYRGRFLRGVDEGKGRDPDANNRTPANLGGNTGDACGSVEGYATGAPINGFTMSTDGKHSHTVDHMPNDYSSSAVAGSYQSVWNSDSAPTEEDGKHIHTIEGGDAESRPLNVYVNFLIKFRD